jgi:hypothetical protein
MVVTQTASGALASASVNELREQRADILQRIALRVETVVSETTPLEEEPIGHETYLWREPIEMMSEILMRLAALLRD